MNQRNQSVKARQTSSPHRQVSELHAYQGPLPPAEQLQAYNQIDPNFANRIITMAESEMSHRHKMEKRATNSAVIFTAFGIFFAFSSVLVVSCLVYYALTLGFDTTASAIAVGCIATVASVFVFFKRAAKAKQDK